MTAISLRSVRNWRASMLFQKERLFPFMTVIALTVEMNQREFIAMRTAEMMQNASSERRNVMAKRKRSSRVLWITGALSVVSGLLLGVEDQIPLLKQVFPPEAVDWMLRFVVVNNVILFYLRLKTTEPVK